MKNSFLCQSIYIVEALVSVGVASSPALTGGVKRDLCTLCITLIEVSNFDTLPRPRITICKQSGEACEGGRCGSGFSVLSGAQPSQHSVPANPFMPRLPITILYSRPGLWPGFGPGLVTRLSSSFLGKPRLYEHCSSDAFITINASKPNGAPFGDEGGEGV